MIKEIHIIDCNNDLIMTLRELFEEERTFRFRNINPDKLELSLKSIPSLIIINEESINEDVLELCEKIRKILFLPRPFRAPSCPAPARWRSV